MSDLDPDLQAMFAEPAALSSDPEFTAQIMRQIEHQSRNTIFTRLGIGVAVLLVASLFALPFEIAQFITSSLTLPLFNFGGGWLGWILMPVNNAGALVLLLFKFLRLAQPRRRELHGSLLPF